MTAKNDVSSDSPEFAIQQFYVKDLSYEAPHTPQIFREEWQPEVTVDLNIGHVALSDSFHEVTLRVTLTAKKAAKIVFIIEVKQAGIFMLKGFAKTELERLLKTTCPTILFPFAREEISSRIIKGGFPPIHLAPFNFEAQYLQHQVQPTTEEPLLTH